VGQPQQPSAAAGEATPDAGGKIITVEMTSDEKGNYFTPKKVEAKVGDVVRYTLKVGVHNVHFLPDSNPGKTGLPAPSDMLQLPGQTHDLKVAGAFAPGTYYFQCDPHALLGMQGHLIVSK
jgi:plastocyanin